ncbi:MAG TPA: hypothetical protein VLH13_00885, partial [Methanomassiliicoccales archaeon]|nr:hypothetical protein [Methanomassiliicoccales archaeon]
MAEDQVPIWQVIEEFKDKIKVQEADLKRRRDELDLIERKLRDEERDVAELKRATEAREKTVSEREKNVSERDDSVRRKEAELMALETDLAGIERQLHSERSSLETRQVEISSQEADLLRLVEASAVHEKRAQEAMTHLTEVEDRLLAEE